MSIPGVIYTTQNFNFFSNIKISIFIKKCFKYVGSSGDIQWNIVKIRGERKTKKKKNSKNLSLKI